DRQRRAILDRAAGVEELGLAENPAAGGRRRLAQVDERRVADGVEEAVTNVHGADVARDEEPRATIAAGRRVDQAAGGSAQRRRSWLRWSASHCRAMTEMALTMMPLST